MKQRNQSEENKNQAYKRKDGLITAIWLRKSHACTLMQRVHNLTSHSWGGEREREREGEKEKENLQTTRVGRQRRRGDADRNEHRTSHFHFTHSISTQ